MSTISTKMFIEHCCNCCCCRCCYFVAFWFWLRVHLNWSVCTTTYKSLNWWRWSTMKIHNSQHYAIECRPIHTRLPRIEFMEESLRKSKSKSLTNCTDKWFAAYAHARTTFKTSENRARSSNHKQCKINSNYLEFPLKITINAHN